MINPLDDDIVSLAEAARRLPHLRNNRPVHVSTIWRWSVCGLRGIKLETTLCGGVRVTSGAALRRFFAALNESTVPEMVDSDRGDDAGELDRIGI
jgi:hypothetical protein